MLRWLALLELQDLSGDVLFGYLALDLVDARGFSAHTAALGVAAWGLGDLAGNLLVARILDRISSLRWLRLSALCVGASFPVFQLASVPGVELALIAVIALLRAGWYPISQAHVYEALAGRSGVAMALSTSAGALGVALPLVLGLLASREGVHAALWLVLVAPVVTWIGAGPGSEAGTARAR